MKKTLILLSSVALLSAAFITGCKKDDEDTTAPVIYLNGDNPDYSILKFAYIDEGATATDDVDGTVTVTSSGTVNKDIAGTYTLSYTATDASANAAVAASRTVSVVDMSGSYAAFDSCGASTDTTYSESITVNNTAINFSKFANYINAAVNGTISGNNRDEYTINIPSQTVMSGNPAANRTFSGTGTIEFAKVAGNVVRTIRIEYSETTNGNTVSCTEVYTK